MKKALIIVAHPDDETIWMGGTILKNAKWNWTIISLCRSKDPDRSPKFKKVCKRYKAESIISNIDDENLKPLSIKNLALKIKKLLPEKNYDYVFTHGKNGEYGHIRHIETHKAVKILVDNKSLSCKKLYFFSYQTDKEKSTIPSPTEKADSFTHLTKKQTKEKIQIVVSLYGFDKSSFEAQSCNKKEAFTEQK